MTDENKRVIEVHGIKMEVDLRYAKRVETYKVGDPVKLLLKEYSGYNDYPGVIAGFADFQNFPAIEILYLLRDGDIKFYTFTEKSEAEIAPFNDYEMVFTRSDILAKIDRQIAEYEEKIRAIKSKRVAFDNFFGKAFQNELVNN